MDEPAVYDFLTNRIYGRGVDGYRQNSIKAARELLYGTNVIENLENAKTESEICRIMTSARKKRIEKEDGE